MKILVDCGGYLNFGDISMLEGATLRLLHVLPQAEISVTYRAFDTVLWDMPEITKQPEYNMRPGIENIFASLFREKSSAATARIVLPFLGSLLSANSVPLSVNGKLMSAGEFCEHFDALHLSGGGYLTDTFYIQLLRKCCLILAFTEQSKPVVLTGQQIGPFRSRFSKSPLLRALRAASFVGLRDPADSLTMCQSANLPMDSYEVMGDDSFGLPPVDDMVVARVLSDYGLNPRGFIGLNVRRNRRYNPLELQQLHEIGELVDKIADRLKMPVLIVPIAYDPVEGDLVTGEEMTKYINSATTLMLDHKNLTPALIKGVLSQAFGALGVSYHFCMFALSGGVPTICIYDGRYYSQKARSLCVFWRDERLALSLDNVQINSAAEHILNIFEDNRLRSKLSLNSQQAAVRWRDVFDRRVNQFFI